MAPDLIEATTTSVAAMVLLVSVKPTDRLLTLATLAEGSDTTNLVILCRMLRNGETNGNIQQN